MRTRWIALAVLALGFALAGCGGDSPIAPSKQAVPAQATAQAEKPALASNEGTDAKGLAAQLGLTDAQQAALKKLREDLAAALKALAEAAKAPDADLKALSEKKQALVTRFNEAFLGLLTDAQKVKYAEIQAQAKVQAEAKVQDQAKAQAEAKVREQAKAQAEAKVREQAKAQAEAKVREQANAQTKAKAEAKVREQAGSKAESTSLADQLGLNARQCARLEAIQAKYRELAKKVAEEGKAQGVSQEEMARRSLRLRNAYDTEVMSILTDEQKAKYERMKAGGEQRTSAGK